MAASRSDIAGRSTLGTGALVVLAFFVITALVQRFDAPPLLAVVALLLGATALLLWPDSATLLTVFLLYINFPAVLTKAHGVPAIVAGAFTLLLGIPLVRIVVLRREPLRVDRTIYLMLVLLAVLVVSSFFAKDKGIALDAVQSYVLEGLVLYWLFINVIRDAATLRRVIWTSLSAGAFLSSLSLYQTATGSYDQEFGGLARRRFETTEEDPEREGPQKREKWDRASGPQLDPNRFGQILIVLIPLAVYLHRTARSRTSRLWGAGLGLLILAGILITLSRGAFITLVLMAGTMMGLRWIRTSRMAVCILLLALAAPAVPFLLDRVSSISNSSKLVGDQPGGSRTADGAMRGRMTLMLAALYTFADHPIVGVGPGQFPPFYSQKYGRDPSIKFRDLPPGSWRAHSLYLEIAAETGAIGLVAFFTVVGVILRRLWRARRVCLPEHPELSDLATAYFLSLVAYLTTAVFLHLTYQRYYWFLLATAGAALAVLRPQLGVEERRATRTRATPALTLRTGG